MADDELETAAPAPPDTPHGSEVGELDEHGKALGSSFRKFKEEHFMMRLAPPQLPQLCSHSNCSFGAYS